MAFSTCKAQDSEPTHIVSHRSRTSELEALALRVDITTCKEQNCGLLCNGRVDGRTRQLVQVAHAEECTTDKPIKSVRDSELRSAKTRMSSST
jgi:hypothetical protein